MVELTPRKHAQTLRSPRPTDVVTEPGAVVALPNWSHGTTFEATPISPSGARAFVSHHLVDYRLLHLVEPVRLVVSELATNALVQQQTPFVVTLSRRDDTVRLTVTDDSDWVAGSWSDQALPVGGRGLKIVNVFSRDWGVSTAAGSRTVWALFNTRGVRSA